jgi:4-diphosphocytidyl-2C-methyl-D-erythritol kinase
MEAAQATGADVPVCLDPRPRAMRGIGEILSDPIDLPQMPAVLVNPGVAVPTREVFAALGLPPGKIAPASRSGLGVADEIAKGRNDLEAPAIELQPVIAKVLSVLRNFRLHARPHVGLGGDLLRLVRSDARCRCGGTPAAGRLSRLVGARDDLTMIERFF